MRFTAKQYDEAIKSLQDAKTQLEPDGNCCAVCGDSGHMAFECGHNPLRAMAMCRGIAKSARTVHVEHHKTAERGDLTALPTTEVWEKTHNLLHWLGGECSSFGEPVGPAYTFLPNPE